MSHFPTGWWAILLITGRIWAASSDPCDPDVGRRDAAWYRESVDRVATWRKEHPGDLTRVDSADITTLARWVDILRWEGAINPAGMGDLPNQIRWSVGAIAQNADRAAAANACRRRLETVTAAWWADGTVDGSGPWRTVTGWTAYQDDQGTLTFNARIEGTATTVPLVLGAFAGGTWRIRHSRPGLFVPDRFSPVVPALTRNGDALNLEIPGSQVELRQQPWRLTLGSGDRVLYDLTRLEVLLGADGSIIATRTSAALDPASRFLGGGERFAGVDHRGRVLTHWATDAILSSVDALWSEAYKPIPWLVDPRGLGLFLNNTAPIHLDLGASDPRVVRTTVAGPAFDLFLFAAPPRESLARFQQLTGPCVRPPTWAFTPWIGAGTEVWNSRGRDQGPAYVQEVVERLAKEDIPCGVLFIEGIANHTPPGRALLGWLQDRGLRAVNWYGPNGDPATENHHAWSPTDYENFFLHRADGSLFRVAPGRFLEGQAYVDFTHPDIDAYLEQRWGWHAQAGIAGNMIDGAEEVPRDAVAANGLTGTELHNAYGHFYNQAMARLFQRHRGDDHVLLARSGGAGRQGVCHFAGDLPGTWDGLAAAVRAGQTAGASGLTMWGSDIGGYYEHGGPLGSELFLRWTAFATFSPLMRLHGQQPHFPWLWDAATLARFRRFAWIRQGLGPYLAACADACHDHGAPFLAPLDFAGDPSPARDNEYLLGDALLVAPMLTPGTARPVAFPPGTWFDLLDGFRPHHGSATTTVDAPLERIPVFLGEGRILPLLGGPTALDLGSPFPAPGTPWLVVSPDANGRCLPRKLPDGEARVDSGTLSVSAGHYRVLVVTTRGAKAAGPVAPGQDLELGGR